MLTFKGFLLEGKQKDEENLNKTVAAHKDAIFANFTSPVSQDWINGYGAKNPDHMKLMLSHNGQYHDFQSVSDRRIFNIAGGYTNPNNDHADFLTRTLLTRLKTPLDSGDPDEPYPAIPGKYQKHVARILANTKFTFHEDDDTGGFTEDEPRIRDAFANYHHLASKNVLLPEHRNLDSVKDLDLSKLESIVSHPAYDGKRIAKKGSFESLNEGEDFLEHTKSFAKTDQYRIFEPLTLKGSKVLCRRPGEGESVEHIGPHTPESNWCTRYPDNFNSYSEGSPLFIIHPKENDQHTHPGRNEEGNSVTGAVQWHFSSSQYKDKNDKSQVLRSTTNRHIRDFDMDMDTLKTHYSQHIDLDKMYDYALDSAIKKMSR